MRHCEPVRKLAWQSVLLNVLLLTRLSGKQELLRVRIPTAASRPRNDIDFFDTLNMGLTKVSSMFFAALTLLSRHRLPPSAGFRNKQSVFRQNRLMPKQNEAAARFCGRLFFVFTGDPADERHPWQLRRTSMTIRGMQNSWKRNNPIHLFSHDVAEVCAARFPVAFYPSISDCVSSHREYRQLIAF